MHSFSQDWTLLYGVFQAGGMDKARSLGRVKDAEKESLYGYVYAVSGPGESKPPFFLFSGFVTGLSMNIILGW